MKQAAKETYLHTLFNIGLGLKAIQASLEILSGIALSFLSRNALTHAAFVITRKEILEDPQDRIANYLINLSQQISVSTQHFVALYLLIHGVIKLVLIIALIKKRLWAYPASIIVFSLFIIYELYRFTFTHSPWLIVFSIFDLFVIWLTIHEYRYLKRHYA